MDENGVPFDRELTKNQKERLVEFKALEKELEQEDPFLESAEVLGLFLNAKAERNVPLLGHEVETSSSSSSSSSSGSADTTCTSTTTVIEVVATTAEATARATTTKIPAQQTTTTRLTRRRTNGKVTHTKATTITTTKTNREGILISIWETFVKDVSECLHVNDSIDDETEYKDGNSKGTSSGVSSLDVSHEQL